MPNSSYPPCPSLFPPSSTVGSIVPKWRGDNLPFPYPVLPFSYTRPLSPGYVGFASASFSSPRPLKYSQRVWGIALSSQYGLRLSPVEVEFSCYILTLKSDIWLDWWHQFINFPENQLTTLYAIQATLQCTGPRSGWTTSSLQNI